MTTDWDATLAEEGKTAKSKVREVTTLVQDPNLSLAAASVLYLDVERHAQRFDKLFDKLDAEINFNSPLLETGETIQDLWAQMSRATVNKLRGLQGLPTIPMMADDEAN